MFFRTLDYFVYNKISDRQARFRARSLIFLLLSPVVMNLVFFALNWDLTVHSPSLMMSFAAFCVVVLGLLFYTKRFGNAEWVSVGYLSYVVASVNLRALSEGSALLLWAGLSSLMIFYAFVMTNKKSQRIFFTLLSLGFSIAVYLLSHHFQSNIAYGLDKDNFRTFVIVGILFFLAHTLILTHFYMSLREHAHQELEHDAEFHLRDAKLLEFSAISKKMIPQFGRHLEALQRDLSLFIQSSGHDSLAFQRMKSRVAQMTEISQTVRWIYQAYRNSDTERTNAWALQEKLSSLFVRESTEVPWTIRFTKPEENFSLQGPLPSLVLLIHSLALQLLENGEKNKVPAELDLSLGTRDSLVYVRMSRPAGDADGETFPSLESQAEDHLDPFGIRFELIADLIRESGARVCHYVASGRWNLELWGEWSEVAP